VVHAVLSCIVITQPCTCVERFMQDAIGVR
jgi:hypothetical protein